MRVAGVECVLGCLDDIRRGIEIGLADLEMDDVLTLSFELAGTCEYDERGLCSELVDALGDVSHGCFREC